MLPVAFLTLCTGEFPPILLEILVSQDIIKVSNDIRCELEILYDDAGHSPFPLPSYILVSLRDARGLVEGLRGYLPSLLPFVPWILVTPAEPTVHSIGVPREEDSWL